MRRYSFEITACHSLAGRQSSSANDRKRIEFDDRQAAPTSVEVKLRPDKALPGLSQLAGGLLLARALPAWAASLMDIWGKRFLAERSTIPVSSGQRLPRLPAGCRKDNAPCWTDTANCSQNNPAAGSRL